jgi:hypothetical protein
MYGEIQKAPPDDLLLWMILFHLDAWEPVADRRRAEQAPKLHVIGQQGPGDPPNRRLGK